MPKLQELIGVKEVRVEAHDEVHDMQALLETFAYYFEHGANAEQRLVGLCMLKSTNN